MSLLDAKIHSLRGANHGDGQQEVVADLHRSPGTHTPTVGDLKYAQLLIVSCIKEVFSTLAPMSFSRISAAAKVSSECAPTC